ncbi:GIY-YIG nuclease family protein [uncultured Rhodoblastus sp.]|uniref:GIY-YIG nuclease family protein n=1 Tax=uncultured Rhodoblastus sp. TaxID=543037 RepID=UPI0025F8BB4F|nr:GIY-YIG nuclease family protein [uncultured Rhodoblastus sp.]
MTRAHIFILQCADGSFYTGLTRRDPVERASEHEQGLDPHCFTYSRRPVTLVYTESFERVDEAIATERRIKGWTRAKKKTLIERDYETLVRLASRAKE